MHDGVHASCALLAVDRHAAAVLLGGRRDTYLGTSPKAAAMITELSFQCICSAKKKLLYSVNIQKSSSALLASHYY
jgi:hypothetical protein